MFTNKKIDLHLHFDGSLPIAHAYTIAKQMGLYKDLDFHTFSNLMQLDEQCHSLYDYLARFDTPLSLLQKKETLHNSMLELIKTLATQELCYVEVRFAPQQHSKENLTQEEVVQTLLDALYMAKDLYPSIKVNVILCMMILGEEMRTHKENMETIRLAKKYLHKGVVALDLAGGEGMAPMIDFAPLFDEAKRNEIPFLIHAGECCGPENIKVAIQLGAKRIGHGTSAIQDEEVMELLKKNEIPLEVCISSNVDCEVVSSYQAHPAHHFLDYGVPITINTDNMTISNTTLDREYQHFIKEQGFTIRDIENCLKTSIKHSFLSKEEKLLLLQKL